MGKSNLKPSRGELVKNLDHYRLTQNSHMSELEFEVLTSVCFDADRVIRIVSKTALVDVPQPLKVDLPLQNRTPTPC